MRFLARRKPTPRHPLGGRRLESAATVLETDGGEQVRVPNQLVLDSIVTLTAKSENDTG